MTNLVPLILMSLLLAPSLQKSNSALIIHNVRHFDILFSEMVKVMKKSFGSLRIENIVNASSKHSAYLHKKPIYDLIVVMLPRSNNAVSVSEKLELLNFYDEGGNVLFLSDSFVVQNWRVLLSQFGFDVTTEEGTVGDDNGLYISSKSRSIFVEKNAISHPKLSKDLKKGIVYEGGAVTLTPYENRISWTLLEAPEKALFKTSDGMIQVIDNNKMNLVVGAQGQTNKARLLIVGSFKMFSNKLNAESEGDNLLFFRNIINWLKFESQVLTIKNFAVCNAKTNHCGNPLNLPNQHGFYAKFQIFNEDGEFYIPPEGKLSLKFTKQVQHMNLEPDVIEENGQKFYYKKLGPIENGVYKIKITHDKPGFYLNSKENTRMLYAITTPISQIEIFQIEGLPFLIIIFGVMLSALNLMLMTKGKK